MYTDRPFDVMYTDRRPSDFSHYEYESSTAMSVESNERPFQYIDAMARFSVNAHAIALFLQKEI